MHQTVEAIAKQRYVEIEDLCSDSMFVQYVRVTNKSSLCHVMFQSQQSNWSTQDSDQSDCIMSLKIPLVLQGYTAPTLLIQGYMAPTLLMQGYMAPILLMQGYRAR